MVPRSPDTIAAIATAPGRGGVGIVRISGHALADFTRAMLGRLPPPRLATFSHFRDAAGTPLDHGLALWFPAPQSFTGEDVLELHGHGGPVVMQMLLERCRELGARLAEPGEFSRRAFLNGKLDLAQAEAVADLIEASTTQAARSAQRSLSGAFSREIDGLADELIALRTLVEATLDFPEEEIDFLKAAHALERLASVRERLDNVLDRARQGALLRSGIDVVLVGPPNVGKSSLLNALAGFERAIVTDIAGTTRDTLRETIQIEGIPLHIIDTAGLRDTDDPVERLGVARSWSEIERADAILRLVDGRSDSPPADDAIDARLPAALPRITVHNKIDLREQPPPVNDERTVWLSAKTGAGIDALRHALLRTVGWHPHGEDVVLARARHLDALRTARDHLDRAFGQQHALELFAEELRLAHDALGEITGRFTPDDLLGEIFSRFCIGK